MLALTPTPEESWPPHPTSVPRTQFNGVFSMVRGKLKPPASRSLQRLQTLCVAKLSNSLLVTAAVQLAKPVQKPVPARAVSKNGCGVTAATAPALPAAPQAAKDVAQPIAFSTAA